MVIKNKKAQTLTDLIVILLSLVFFFWLYPAIDAVKNNAKVGVTDTYTVFFIDIITFVLLAGIVKLAFTLGSISQ